MKLRIARKIGFRYIRRDSTKLSSYYRLRRSGRKGRLDPEGTSKSYGIYRKDNDLAQKASDYTYLPYGFSSY